MEGDIPAIVSFARSWMRPVLLLGPYALVEGFLSLAYASPWEFRLTHKSGQQVQAVLRPLVVPDFRGNFAHTLVRYFSGKSPFSQGTAERAKLTRTC